jgi:hypothetical protein
MLGRVRSGEETQRGTCGGERGKGKKAVAEMRGGNMKRDRFTLRARHNE